MPWASVGSDAVITTKVSGFGAPEGVSGGSPEWISQAIDNSLQRLGTDYVDLYLLHMPDAKTPIGDTLEAFGKLVAAGKVREIGCSNFSAQMLEDAAAAAKELGVPQFVNVQNNYSVLDRTPEAEVIPACEKLGITLMPYFPLASGVLTGQVQARRAGTPEGTRLAAWGDRAKAMLSDEKHGRGRSPHGVREGPRAHAARARALVPRQHANGRERHRRRDVAGAAEGERGGHRARGSSPTPSAPRWASSPTPAVDMSGPGASARRHDRARTRPSGRHRRARLRASSSRH